MFKLLLLIAGLLAPVQVIANQANEYHIGRGMADLTGPALGVQLWGFGRDDQFAEGIHLRQKARAFVVVDPSRNTRVALVTVDIGSIEHHITLQVIDRLKQKFGDQYRLDNVLISATHTHAAPTGYWHSRSNLGFDGGFYGEHFDNIVAGIVEAISIAHAGLKPGNIALNKGRVEGAGVNRSMLAYQQNPQSERDQYRDPVDKDMTLLKFTDTSGDVGMLNWFAVHPTSMTFFNRLISGDHKGYASLKIERANGVSYTDPNDFVAAFAMTNAGDVTPNLNLDNTRPW